MRYNQMSYAGLHGVGFGSEPFEESPLSGWSISFRPADHCGQSGGRLDVREKRVNDCIGGLRVVSEKVSGNT